MQSAHSVLGSVEATKNTECIQYDITVINWNHQNGCLVSHKIIRGGMFLLTQKSLCMKFLIFQEETMSQATFAFKNGENTSKLL